MHLVGFIIRIYHDSRTSERQICSLQYALLINGLTNPFTDFSNTPSSCQAQVFNSSKSPSTEQRH